MLGSKRVDALCAAAAVFAALFAALAVLLAQPVSSPQYAQRLFDASRVHTLDIALPDWTAFVASADKEAYMPCTVTVDGEAFHQVGVRAKGNNSLRLAREYGLSRTSLKLEFDHFTPGASYHGLDKFSLDASFQDNSYLKTFLAYDMMAYMQVPAPLCSYVWVTVNGAPWGLFLAVEEPEEAFARRNFGADHGELYQPDYRSLADENADVALRYIGDDEALYPGIFDNAKFETSPADRARLIGALKTLASGRDLETAVEVDGALRYFVVQVFVMNWDSYLGHTGHNYYLYEEDGVLRILPWDYNLAFGTYALGMPDPVRDAAALINYPIDTPAPGSVMTQRPLYHELMKNDGYFARYHAHWREFLEGYFASGRFEALLAQTSAMIAPYVEADPTAYCGYADHRLAVDALRAACLARAESAQGQLAGTYPATLRAWQRSGYAMGVDAGGVDFAALGDFDDLRGAKERQDAALAVVQAAG